MFRSTLTLTLIGLAAIATATANGAGGDQEPGTSRDNPAVIRGKNDWVSVGKLRPEGIRLDYRNRKSVNAGWLSFPEGRLPENSRRQYVGVTAATIRVRPASEAPAGIDYLNVDVGGWPFAMIEVKRTRRHDCRNEVVWSGGGMLSGSWGGRSCNGVIRLKESNYLTYGSVRPGTRTWRFHLSSLGRPLIESAKIAPASRVGITKRRTSGLKLQAPSEVNLRSGKAANIPVIVKNTGARRTWDLQVHSWVKQGPADWPAISSPETRRVAALKPGQSRRVHIPVQPLVDGKYNLFLVVGDRTSSDLVRYRIRVGEPLE